MTDSENSDERKAREAEQADYDRLLEVTREQLMLGPKGMPPDFDPEWQEIWQRRAKQVSRGITSIHELMPDILPLVWCRVHLSVVNMVQEDPNYLLIHYSFENLSDEVLPVNLSHSLFTSPPRTQRFWITEDITTGERTCKDPYDRRLVGVSSNGGMRIGTIDTNLLLSPCSIATITSRGGFNIEGGFWSVGGFGKCFPGHTYKFQLIFGGLPSNVFTWIAPD